jgi:hypothetical protein
MHNPPTYRTGYRECCTDLKCESGLRNNYFEGKRLTVDSFRVEQKYLLERRRLLNRAIHGWGVVYGYSIAADSPDKATGPRGLKIGAGLALDPWGRELLQNETHIDVDDMIFLNDDGVRIDPERAFSEARPYNRQANDYSPPKCWLLSVHYAEQYAAPVIVEDPCRCTHHEWDHTCETVRYSLRRIPCADCCRDFECELCCECGTGPCCDRSLDVGDAHVDVPRNRGGCRCLCEHLTQLLPGAECGSLCEIEEPCARVRVDLRNGVPLACVELDRDDCERWTFGGEVESCGPRRLVKRNDLLFDLVRGCDLTRISDIGWRDWHRLEDPISLKEFSEALGPDGNRQDEYVTRDFWVTFSRPVHQDTLRPDCFAMTIMSGEREGGWWQTFRVPILRVDTTLVPPEPGDPADHVRSATIVVDGAWVEDGVRGRRSLFLGGETRVELEVRGDFIIDCSGQAVDANAVGLSPVPTGNGTPGGTFLSTFRVAPAPAHTVGYDSGERQTGVSS